MKEEEESKENDLLHDLRELIPKLNFEEKDDKYIMTHLIVNQSNFLWLLLNLIIKYNNLNGQVKGLIRNLIKNCLKNNIFSQDLFKQKRISNLFENQKKKNNDILIDIIKLLFKEFPRNLISNQIYLDLFLII